MSFYHRLAGFLCFKWTSDVLSLGEQDVAIWWRNARLPPMCPGFISRTRCHMWIEFNLLLVLFSRVLRFFPSPQKPTFPIRTWNARAFLNEFLWTPWRSVGKKLHIIIFSLKQAGRCSPFSQEVTLAESCNT